MGAFEKVKAILESRNLDSLKITQIPQPESLIGVENAANLLREAILGGKKLAIIGDYDADGICATCIMREFFAALSREIRREIALTLKIPNRFTDGYGANPAMISEIDADIFITVDNGISAFEAAAACQKLGKTLIITDHHKPQITENGEVLPSAAIIINPHLAAADFAQKDICGAVVAWYLCGGIKKAFGANLDLKALTRFLAIAIIADMMPLFGLNRALYKLGIAQIQATSDPAFVALREKYALDSGEIGFKIAPLINSVGRLRDAQIALDFFAARTKAAATAALDSLIALNNERKATQNAVFSAAKDSAFSTQNLVVAFGSDWHLGVLGIVAARLCEDSGKSAFCFSLKDGVLKGSGRSNSRVNLIATIQRCASFLLHFGGHSGAVGLSLSRENLDGFIAAFEENLMPDSPPDSPPPIEISLVEADLALLELLESFEPYGMGNEELRFVARGVRVESARQLGNNPHFQALTLAQNGTNCNAVWFEAELEILGCLGGAKNSGQSGDSRGVSGCTAGAANLAPGAFGGTSCNDSQALSQGTAGNDSQKDSSGVFDAEFSIQRDRFNGGVQLLIENLVAANPAGANLAPALAPAKNAAKNIAASASFPPLPAKLRESCAQNPR